jgi:hypothetical protein
VPKHLHRHAGCIVVLERSVNPPPYLTLLTIRHRSQAAGAWTEVYRAPPVRGQARSGGPLPMTSRGTLGCSPSVEQVITCGTAVIFGSGTGAAALAAVEAGKWGPRSSGTPMYL